jgi:Mn-dependent DtxR family transcriptional regulator
VIHQLEADHEVVMPTRISQVLGVSGASATNMCMRLASQGTVDWIPRNEVVVTGLPWCFR